MKKIVVTGMGAVTPVGIGVENYWTQLRLLIRLNSLFRLPAK